MTKLNHNAEPAVLTIPKAPISPEMEQKDGQATPAIVTNWNAEKGFGFIKFADGRKAFVHVSELCHHLNPGRGNSLASNSLVNVGKIVSGEKGFKALKVECGNCIKPSVWELKPTGPAIFGIQELKPVCLNKPDEPDYKCTIKFNEIWEANEPFRQAKEKQTLWEGGIHAKFFEEFGEPQNIAFDGEDQIVLTYPHGTKSVRAYQAYQSAHWKSSPTGKWKEGKTTTEAEFIFDDIPGVKLLVVVADSYGHPKLHKDFELLPSSAQNEILAVIKSSIRSPENIAQERFQRFVLSEYTKNDIDKLRQKIIDLQTPGEVYITSQTFKTQGYEPLSLDERRGNFHYDTQVTEWSLVVGAKKLERPNWRSDYTGGKTFPILSKETGRFGSNEKFAENAELVRQTLLSQTRRQLLEMCDREKTNDTTIPSEPRLYDITPEEWDKRYIQTWEALQKEIEQQWQHEDNLALEQIKADEETYKKVVIELRQTREQVESLDKHARDLRIDLSSLNSLGFGEIGTDSSDRLSEVIQSLRQYITEANILIANQLQQRDKVDIAVTKPNAEAAAALDTDSLEIYGVCGLLLIIAKDFAEHAATVATSPKTALSLVQKEYEASYGRARRQSALQNLFGGEGLSENTARIFTFSRAEDLNQVLYAVTKILQEKILAEVVKATQDRKPTTTQTKILPASTAHISKPPATEPNNPVKPDLSQLFGGGRVKMTNNVKNKK